MKVRGTSGTLEGKALADRGHAARAAFGKVTEAFRRGASTTLARVSGRLFAPSWDWLGLASGMARPRVTNRGSLVIGEGLALRGATESVSLTISAGATLRIGDRVAIDHGSWISASREVVLGNDVRIGPNCVISDADADTREAREDATPIHIGDRVVIGARVVIRPGARIGEGAMITAGSVVEGTIPPFATVSGVPARAQVERAHVEEPEEGDEEEPIEEAPPSGIRTRITGQEAVDASR